MRPSRAAAAALLLGLGGAAAVAGTRAVERRVTDEVRRAAAAAGATVGEVRFSWFEPLRLERVRLPSAAGGQVTVDAVSLSWRVNGGSDPRAHLGGLTFQGVRFRRGTLSASIPIVQLEVIAWDRAGSGERVLLRQPSGGGTLEARWSRLPGRRTAEVAMTRLDLAAGEISWKDERLLRPGRWSGRATLDRPGSGIVTAGEVSLEGLRLSLGGLLDAPDATTGEPTDLALEWSARGDHGSLEVARAAARAPAFHVSVRGLLGGRCGERAIDAEVSAQAELGGLMRAAGLRVPEPLDATPGVRVGTASFDVSVRGALDQPASLRIVPRLGFEPAPEAVEALAFLRRPFRYTPQESGARLNVSAGASSFVPLSEVPPAFVRMLLVSEDAGFFGHPGIDVAEIPVAWAENLDRGRFARGASTITQQLARNLFLSRDKSYGRKVEEAALALALDAAVPKARILEIYLNVIEWGPGVYGLSPAAHHYFGKHPSQLTLKEMAFLVCLVPSPVRYHSAHRAGRAGPGMEQLMANLLDKMFSAGAIDSVQYEGARAEVLAFAPEPGEKPAQTVG